MEVMALREITFGLWEDVTVESANSVTGMARRLVSAVLLTGRRDLMSCAGATMHNTLKMNAINSLQKYEKSSVYIFLINERFL
jgi:hypothetical protein